MKKYELPLYHHVIGLLILATLCSQCKGGHPLNPFFFLVPFIASPFISFGKSVSVATRGHRLFLHHSFLVLFLNVQVRAAFFWHLCVCSAKGSLGPRFPIIPTSCHFFSGAFQGCIED